MRILVDAHVFDGSFQGTRTYLEGLYTHMTHHTDIDFFFAAQNLSRLKAVFGEASNIHYVSLSSSNKWKRLATEFPRIIKDNQIDYAHYQYISPLKKTCSEIVTVHDLLFMDLPQYFPLSYRLPKRVLFRRSALKADILLTVSDYSKESIARNFGIDKDRIHLTYNSILPADMTGNVVDIKSKYGFDKYILIVSRIEPRKNHYSLLRAYYELGLWKSGYHLVMIGSKDLAYEEFFSYMSGIEAKAREMVHILQVPFADLVAFYQGASLFVFPSYGEGFGIPPLEALAYGCPLLCSDATAMAEFGFPDAITFSPSDVDELKQKMMAQLDHPVCLDDVREKVFDKYNWQSISDSFYEILMSQK